MEEGRNERKPGKRERDWKRTKLFTYGTIRYVKNPKESTEKTLELIKEFSKTSVYTSHEQSENEKKII